MLAGASWGLAVAANTLIVIAIVGALAAVWGSLVVQLTPTGGVIMENKTTVNYAVLALHGWLTFFACLSALLVWALRLWLV